MALKQTTVTIHGARGAEWISVLGTATLPVKSPLPVRAQLPGIDNAEVYLVALDALQPGQLDKIVAHVSRKFGVPVEDVRQELKEHGMPILADDCSCAIDIRAFL